ncbi:MAG: DUF58 domain-containing protein [Pseudomonadota bacterium]
MAVSVGTSVAPQSAHEVLARARARAALIPDMLVEAQKIANTLTSGWHGRRRRGTGDAFWQFRPYDQGESMARIDWRRTARDDAITIRDQEWEAAHTVWIWADPSPSMLYQSETASVSKQSRALVLSLAIAEVLAKSGERVGWPGLTNAMTNRDSAERIASALMVDTRAAQDNLPDAANMRSRSELVVVSDFLQPVSDILEWSEQIAKQRIRGSLVQIIDPAEERFPFSGRTEFEDPETGVRQTFGRAEGLSVDYMRLFNARKEMLANQCRKLGWNHLVHHTDTLASGALVALHGRLTGQMEVKGA